MNEKQKNRKRFAELIENDNDSLHPLVLIKGKPEIGKNTYIGAISEVNANKSSVKIGEDCDIASFVSINVADSHKMCLGLADKNERKPIIIENNVFIGSHSFIGGGTIIGHHSVIGAGAIIKGLKIPPYSLIIGCPLVIKEGYYIKKIKNDTTQ